jgi:hypothetical protein
LKPQQEKDHFLRVDKTKLGKKYCCFDQIFKMNKYIDLQIIDDDPIFFCWFLGG